jgi:adenosylhomocysteine nucleosidase
MGLWSLILLSQIAIVGAMENEIGFLRRAMSPPCPNKDKYVTGTIASKTIMLLRTGVGPHKTVKRLAETEWAHKPQCILSIGCAGALSPNLKIGDAVIPERIISDGNAEKALFPTVELIRTARNCCEGLNIPFHSGTTISTSEVAATPEEKMALATRYDASAVDMESAQVAAWAEESGVPMLAIRTISDTLHDRIPSEAAGIVDAKGRLRLRSTFSLFISRPALLIRILKLKRNLDCSFATLETIVMALLGQI